MCTISSLSGESCNHISEETGIHRKGIQLLAGSNRGRLSTNEDLQLSQKVKDMQTVCGGISYLLSTSDV